MNKEEKKTITFEHKISANFVTYAISGAYGGLNAFGDVVANFYHERPAIPRKQQCEIKEGRLSIISEEKKDAMIRDVMFGISMSPDIARSLAKWLNEKADEFDKISGQKKEE